MWEDPLRDEDEVEYMQTSERACSTHPLRWKEGYIITDPTTSKCNFEDVAGCRCDFVIMRSLPAVMTVFYLSLRGSGHLLHYAQSGSQLMRSYYLTCVLRLQELERPHECP